MKLSTLQYFCEVAENGNISQTAEKLFVAQPAISRSIKELEKELGEVLFFRTASGVVLTPKGRVFYKYVSEALDLLNIGANEIKNVTSSYTPALRLVTPLKLPFLSDLMVKFQKRYPEIHVSFQQISPQMVDSYDLSIVPYSQIRPNDNTILLLKETFYIVVAKDHPLAQKSEIDLTDTKPYQYILSPEDSPSRQYFNAVCEVAQFHPKIIAESNCTNMIEKVVKSGYAISFNPENSSLISEDGIVAIPIKYPVCRRNIYLCWSNKNNSNQHIYTFCKFCDSYMKKF